MRGGHRHPRQLAGLGVDVGPLAQAQFSGQLAPQYVDYTYTPSYSGDAGVLPSSMDWPRPEAAQGFAQQVASLLGAAVTQVPGNQVYSVEGANFPMVWVMNIGGQIVDPAVLFPEGVILSYPDECTAERALVQGIPGGTLSSTCAAGGTGQTPTQLAISQGATQTNAIVGYSIPTGPNKTTSNQTPATTTNTTNTNTNNTSSNSAAGSSNNVNNVSSGWFLDPSQDILSGVPNIALVGGAALALMMLMIAMKK